MFDRTGIPPGDYTLRVVARDPTRPLEYAAILRNRLWVHGDSTFCATHLINGGTTVDGNTVTVEFRATGVVQDYMCSLDRGEYFPCESHSKLANAVEHLNKGHFGTIVLSREVVLFRIKKMSCNIMGI